MSKWIWLYITDTSIKNIIKKWISVSRCMVKYCYIDTREQYAAIKNNLYLLTKNINIKREREDYHTCLELCGMIPFL